MAEAGLRGAAEAIGWSASVGEVIAHIGTPGLPRVLDGALRQLAAFDLSAIFLYPPAGRPLTLYDGLGRHRPDAALQNELDSAVLLGPFAAACARPVPPGLYRMADLADRYVNIWQVHPCVSSETGALAEEIGYVVTLPGGLTAVYSLMRSAAFAPFDDEEFARLSLVEPVVRAVLRTQWRHLAHPRDHALRSQDGEVVLDRAFAGFCAGVLSRRERMVTQMILRGHSTRSVSAVLGIAEGTVKNHRKSIYSKLGIASQQELFSLFLAHTLGPAQGFRGAA